MNGLRNVAGPVNIGDLGVERHVEWNREEEGR